MNHKNIQLQPWPKEDLERVESCPICGEVDRTLLYERLTDKVFFYAPGLWSLYSCLTCRCAYLDPKSIPDTIATAYSAYYTYNEVDGTPKGRFRLFKRSPRNDYLNVLYNVKIRPTLNFGDWLTFVSPQKISINNTIRHLPITSLKTASEKEILADISYKNGKYLYTDLQLGLSVLSFI